MAGNRNSSGELASRISALSFAVVELRLFIDTHPCDADAIEAYEQYKAQLAECKAEYERQNRTENGCCKYATTPFPWMLDCGC